MAISKGWRATRCKWPLNITNGSDDVAEDNDCNDNYNYPLQMLSGCEVWRKTETYDSDCNDVKKKRELITIETITIMTISYSGVLLMLLIIEESLLLMFVSL